MLRKMTQKVGRFAEGENHDYPRGVWNKIALDLMKVYPELKKQAEGNAQRALDLISEEIDINSSLQSALRGPLKIRQRLGSPARVPAGGRA